MSRPAKPRKRAAPKRQPSKDKREHELWMMAYCFALSGSFSPVDATEAADHGIAMVRAKFFTAEAVGA